MVEDRANLTRQVKDASDIVAVVGSYLTVTPAGGVFKAVCPFHNDTRPSLQIDPKWQNFRCWACGKKGDVFTFISEFEKVSFREARELLARRAGINLEGSPAENLKRGKLLDAVKWAEEKYRDCLNPPDDDPNTPLGERARLYIATRKLTGPTVRAFGLGYAPAAGDWLVRAAHADRRDMGVLQDVGLIAARGEGKGWYDRFRDRVMFPIRDSRGQTVGFGGRILPDSPLADRGPKYYNSSETPLFLKKELLYGLDVARHAGAAEGFLAVVEGYTDVMMAHQGGVTHVVATMGTALNEAHVRQLRRFVPKVVLVFDADEGGTTGVDRALEIFVGCDVELAIATLPAGLDPCDLLAAEGPGPFRLALAGAVNPLDFKVERLLADVGDSLEGQRRVVDDILGVMALAPELPGRAGQVKQELLITRLCQRLGLRQETVWALFGEKKAARKREAARAQAVEARFAQAAPKPTGPGVAKPAAAKRPAKVLERELLQVLLADPGLVPQAKGAIRPEDIDHPGLQQLLATLYFLHDDGDPPDLDGLRDRVDNEALVTWAIDNQEIGRSVADRGAWLGKILAGLRRELVDEKRRQLMERLRAAATDAERQRILREIQELDQGPDPHTGGSSP